MRVAGSYDDAVRDAAAHADATGGLVVSDTSWAGYDPIPRDIMLGYTRLMDEAAAAWAGDGPPDVLLVQAGVGGLLAAVASWSAWTFGPDRPRLRGRRADAGRVRPGLGAGRAPDRDRRAR